MSPSRAFTLLLSIPLVFTGLSADTIFLKNGRRVAADRVTEEETRVVYETSLGKFSLAKSLVDRVERDGARPERTTLSFGGNNGVTTSDSDSRPARRSAPVPSIANSTEGTPERVLVNGGVDRRYLTELARLQPGTPVARELMVRSFNSAVEFEIGHGHVDQALEIARQGTAAAPSEARMWIGQAIAYLQLEQTRQALDAMLRAKSLAPDSAEVWKWLGFVEYSSDRLNEAVKSWKKSLSLAKDGEVEKLLERAERESAAEERYVEANSNHFTLRFEGRQVTATFGREILDTLESLFKDLERDLGNSPREAIAVILYTNQAFYDVTQAPAWTGALFDGKIRVPVDGLSSVSPEFRSVLKHEMTHSFVRARTRERCPAWLNEGLAQLEEGYSASRYAARLAAGLRNQPVPLATLHEPFTGMDGRSANAAYLISLAATEMLRERFGMSEIARLLDQLAAGASIDAALRAVTAYSLEETDALLLEYLKNKS